MANTNNDNKQFIEEVERFKLALEKAIGETIRKPISARLGYKDSAGQVYLKVPDTKTDQPNKWYFHEAGGNSFQGEAFMQPKALSEWQKRYGAPIRIQRDILSREWEIIGIDSRYAAQFFDTVKEDDGTLYPYKKLAPGLLTDTSPESMSAQVLSGAYRVDDEWKFIGTQNTVNWGTAPYSSNVPTTPLTAVWVLVQVNFDTGLLEYKYGAGVPSSLTGVQVYNLNVTLGDNSVLPQPDNRKFRSGYVKLVSGMSRITRDGHIWALQEYLTIGSDQNLGALDHIVTANGEVVVDGLTGNVVYSEYYTAGTATFQLTDENENTLTDESSNIIETTNFVDQDGNLVLVP